MANHRRHCLGFDTRGFVAAVLECAKNFDMTLAEVADETGVSREAICQMRNGWSGGSIVSVAALAAWSGVNPALYSIDHRPPAPKRPERLTEAKALLQRVARKAAA